MPEDNINGTSVIIKGKVYNNVKGVDFGIPNDTVTRSTFYYTGDSDTEPSEVLEGQIFYNVSGQTIGTMPNHQSATISVTSTLPVSIPAGYYDGTGYVEIDITDIESSKIKSGCTILGVDGTFTDDADATENDILADKTAYVNGEMVTGTMTNNGSATITINSTLPVSIPAGYYDGTGYVSVDTTDIAAGNIKEGCTILGVSGNLLPEGTSLDDSTARPSHVLSGESFYYVDDSHINMGDGTMPNHQSATISVTSTLPVSIPAGYYDGTGYVSVDTTDIAAGNIKEGCTILGVPGTIKELNEGSITVVGPTITIPMGYYSSTITKTVNNASITPTIVASGTVTSSTPGASYVVSTTVNYSVDEGWVNSIDTITQNFTVNNANLNDSTLKLLRNNYGVNKIYIDLIDDSNNNFKGYINGGEVYINHSDIASTTNTCITKGGTAQTPIYSFWPLNQISDKILNDTTILGVTGTFTGEMQGDFQVNSNQIYEEDDCLYYGLSDTSSDYYRQGCYFYATNSQLQNAINNLSAGNIKNGVTILGVPGTYSGEAVITDLTGTSWVFNSNVDVSDLLPADSEKLYEITFNSMNGTAHRIKLSYDSQSQGPLTKIYYYMGQVSTLVEVYNSSDGGWTNEDARNITFTNGGGADVSNPYLITWLLQNATKQ